MLEEVCNYQKLYFCKFKDTCRKAHLKEACQDLGAFFYSKNCQKYTLKGAKGTYLKDFCMFGASCCYHHKDESTLLSQNTMEIKIKVDNSKKDFT